MAAPRSVEGAAVPRGFRSPAAAAVRSRLLAVPASVWLVGLITLSFGVRFGLSLRLEAPFIFSDEVIYAELGRSFADSLRFELAQVGSRGFGIIYPILISPAYALFQNQIDAYTAVKAINCLVISLVALPTYFLSRRFVPPGLALLAAALTLLLPSMAYSSTVMTENAFFPLFVTAAYLMVISLERPSIPRQLALVAVFVLAYLTRRQGIVLVPALLSAVGIGALVRAASEPAGRRARRFVSGVLGLWLTWLCLGLAIVAALAVTLGRGQSFERLLGPYESLATADYSLSDTGRWFAYNLAELDLSTGVVPLAALIAIVAVGLRRRSASGSQLAFSATAVSLIVWIILQAAVFAAGSTGVPRIEGRYTFYVAPLLFIGLTVWLGSRRRVPGVLAGCASVVACVIPSLLLNADVLNFTLAADSLGLWPILKLTEIQFSFAEATILIVLALALAGCLFLGLRGRWRVILPALVIAYMAVGSAHVYARMNYLSNYFLGGGIGGSRTWIDDATPPNASVASLWAPSAPNVDWENEFFSAKLGLAYSIGPFLDGLPRTPLTLDRRTGLLTDPDGEPVIAEYVASDSSYHVTGQLVATDPILGTRLQRVGGPIRIEELTSGLYADRISMRTVAYTRPACTGGTLIAEVTSTGLVPAGQTITATDSHGRLLAEATLARGDHIRMELPLRPREGACDVSLTVEPTIVPATVLGNNDLREVGAKVDLKYEP